MKKLSDFLFLNWLLLALFALTFPCFLKFYFFYSVSFCLLKSITYSFKGRRQFHAGEEGQGGNFRNKGRAPGTGGVLLDLIPVKFSPNRSVVDSKHCT